MKILFTLVALSLAGCACPDSLSHEDAQAKARAAWDEESALLWGDVHFAKTSVE